MTVKLLAQWGDQPPGTLFTAATAGTETAMISAGQATATLSGAVPWVPPGSSPGPGPALRALIDPKTGDYFGIDLPGKALAAANSGPTIAWYGDSLIEQGSSYLTPTVVQAQTLTAAFWVKGTELLCPAGVGTLVYDAVAKTLTWAAFGESAGPTTDASRTGLIYVPSSVAGHGIYLDWFGGSRTYTSGSLSITAKASGFNALDTRTSGISCIAMAFALQLLKIAPFADVQNGYEAVYGLGGATTAELADAAWQFTSIVSDVAVVLVGQNDAPAGQSPAQTIAALQRLLPLIDAATIVICTLPPRNGDTTAQKKAKQQVSNWIYRLCSASSRYVVFDMYAYLADPTTGDYVTASSTDNVHPNGIGNTIAGKPLGALLRSIVAADMVSPQRQSFQGQYDATNNPYGSSLVTAGMGTFEGAGGTANTGASGVIPAGYKMARSTGAAMTAVGSKVAYTDKPGSGYRVTLAGAAASEIVTLEPISTLSAGLAAGVKCDCYLYLNVISSSGLEQIILSLYDNGSATQVRAWNNLAGRINDFTGPICLKLPTWTLPVGFTNATLQIKIGTASGGSAVIEFSDLYVGPSPF